MLWPVPAKIFRGKDGLAGEASEVLELCLTNQWADVMRPFAPDIALLTDHSEAGELDI